VVPSKQGPLYKKITEDLRSRIELSELRPGDLLPTRSELAIQYSTTQATVNRAISELSQDGLISSKSGRRTVVTERFEVGGGQGVIAVVWDVRDDAIASGDHSSFGPLMNSIRLACAAKQIGVLLCSSAELGYPAVSDGRTMGMVALAPLVEDAIALERIYSEGKPIVAVPGILGASTIPAVSSDYRTGMREAIDHLMSLKHSDIGFLSLKASLPDQCNRMQAFLEAMATRGLAVQPGRLRTDSYVQPSQYPENVSDWLCAGALPTAIVASDFLMALAVTRRLRKIGARVPEDVSVIHFDDPVAAAHMDPPTTAIAQDLVQLGATAVRQLLAMMRGIDVDKRTLVDTRLVVRHSTAVCRTR
jgi:DNA-binding LacI/PurR family transcriptional regulator